MLDFIRQSILEDDADVLRIFTDDILKKVAKATKKAYEAGWNKALEEQEQEQRRRHHANVGADTNAIIYTKDQGWTE